MKMKLKEVMDRYEGLSKIGGKTFPSKLSFAISYNLRKLQKEVEGVEKERNKIYEEYARKDENGKMIILDGISDGKKIRYYDFSRENKAQVEKEYSDLLEEEVEVEVRKIKREAIEQCEEKDRYTIPTVSDIFGMSFMTDD